MNNLFIRPGDGMTMRSAVLLAGGKGARMGSEKCLVTLEGRPLALWVLDALASVTDEVIVSVSTSPSREVLDALEGLKAVMDDVEGLGPLGGLRSALGAAGGEYVAVAPCDVPLVRPDVYEVLFREAEGRDGAVPVVGGYYEPLVAVYRREAFLKAAEKVMDGGGIRPVMTYEHMDVAFVPEEALKQADPGLESFLNVNTPGDLEGLNGLLLRRKRP